jgi:SAM-dependent methyltransferase
MSSPDNDLANASATRPGLRLVCPNCRGPLEPEDSSLRCAGCRRAFDVRDGFPDLVLGRRFEDEVDEGRDAYEEQCNLDTTVNYWLPLFGRLTPPASARARVLSVGCGTGVDVDLLNDRGYEAVGIDCGNRSGTWPRRRHRDRLFMANGQRLPFEDASFDVAFCGCVFPHVGVEGDSFRTTPRYREDRAELAREMARVVRPGGKIVVSNPNRFFPFDIFHGRAAGGYKVRPYWPTDPFLLSVADYRRLFRPAGCSRARALPVEGYWGFIRSKNHWKGWALGLPVQFLFWLVSREPVRFLRGSPLSPWLVVLIEKDPLPAPA